MKILKIDLNSLKMADLARIHIIICFVLLSNVAVFAWDAVDFELFDLVEEVKTNFYDVLGVPQSASPAEIRRAYRKLSLQLHPDRSEDPNAEEKFRNLVAVSEVLKDEEKRKRYDKVLQDGLPDWRQPVFYYRRVRKMGILEFLAFIFGIFTVGHFVIAWSIYLEKKFELDDLLTSTKKKKEKRIRKLAKQGVTFDDVQAEDILSEEGIHKPTFWDLLPFVLYRLTLSAIRAVRQRRELNKLNKIRLQLLQEQIDKERAQEAELEATKTKKRQRITPQLPTASSEEYAKWEGAPPTTLHSIADEDDSKECRPEESIDDKNGEWGEEDLSKLSRLMIKYPGGTPGRWEKVAFEMGKSVKDITQQVKQTKSRYKEHAVEAGEQPKLIASRKMVTLDENIATQAVRYEENGLACHTEKNGNAGHQGGTVVDKGYSTASVPSSATCEDSTDEKSAWSQNQQKMFEKALASVAKDAQDRWVQIARNVPGKTKEECVARYKYLVEILKKRRRGDAVKVG